MIGITSAERSLLRATTGVDKKTMVHKVKSLLEMTDRIRLSQNHNGKTIAQHVVDANCKDLLLEVIKYAKRTGQSLKDENLLIHSVDFDKKEAFDVLLQTPEINMNEKGSYGQTALHSAARSWDSYYLEKLIEAGVDYVADSGGELPHEVATRYNMNDYKSMLLDYQLEITLRNKSPGIEPGL